MMSSIAQSLSAATIALAAASGAFGLEALAAAITAAPGERGFTFMILFGAWLSFLPVIAVSAAFLAPAGIALARARALARPVFDVAGAGLFAAASPFVASFVLDLFFAFGREAPGFDVALGDALAIGGIGAAYAVIPGAVAGYVYWRAAGRPQPPYGARATA